MMDPGVSYKYLASKMSGVGKAFIMPISDNADSERDDDTPTNEETEAIHCITFRNPLYAILLSL